MIMITAIFQKKIIVDEKNFFYITINHWSVIFDYTSSFS